MRIGYADHPVIRVTMQPICYSNIAVQITGQPKKGKRTKAERARIELLSQQFFPVMADNFWNVAVTRKDMVATGYLPTLAGRYM